MYQIGYCEHFVSLKRQYPQFQFQYPRDWSLKDYGTLFIYDLIKKREKKRVLEIGPGYDTFFAEQMKALGVEYWCVDRSNDYLGIVQNRDKYNNCLAQREKLGAKYVDGLLGQDSQVIPSGYFDLVFSISVIEHIEKMGMGAVAGEIGRILQPGGESAHSVDTYYGSTKAKDWHEATCAAGLAVQAPNDDQGWSFGGPKTTFIENPKIRYLIYNSTIYKDPLMEGAPFVTHFATVLHIGTKSAPG